MTLTFVRCQFQTYTSHMPETTEIIHQALWKASWVSVLVWDGFALTPLTSLPDDSRILGIFNILVVSGAQHQMPVPISGI